MKGTPNGETKMTSFNLTVNTLSDGWVVVSYAAKTVREALDWAMSLDGVTGVMHIGVKE
jgi:hypothetical protein